MLWFLGDLVRAIIVRWGRLVGAPTVRFEKKQIMMEVGELRVGWFWRFLTGMSGFFLPLPANTWGIVVHPDGNQECPSGGFYQAAPGLYQILYVDQHQHHEYTQRVSEVTTDGEKLTLSMLVHYRIANPLVARQIDCPVETLMANIETDLAQYIRTHAHNEIAESSDLRERGRIHQFFHERHLGRNLLSRAFRIDSVEIKDFTGDAEYYTMRREHSLQQRRAEIAAEQREREREIERINTSHDLELQRQKTESQAQIKKLEARILDDIKTREIELNHLRLKDERQYKLLVDLLAAMKEVIEHAAYTRGVDLKSIVDQLRETIMSVMPLITNEKAEERVEVESDLPPLSPAEQKIKNLTNTLRNLLK